VNKPLWITRLYKECGNVGCYESDCDPSTSDEEVLVGVEMLCESSKEDVICSNKCAWLENTGMKYSPQHNAQAAHRENDKHIFHDVYPFGFRVGVQAKPECKSQSEN